MPDGRAIKQISGGCGDVVFVCRKCSKKLGGGFGPDGRTRLAKALREVFGAGRGPSLKKRRRHRRSVVETGCLGLCPKGAVVAARPGPAGPIIIIPKGADVDEVAAALGLSGTGDPP